MAGDETRVCPECGSENPEGAVVCGGCSAILLGSKPKEPTNLRAPVSPLAILTAVLAALGMVSMGLTAIVAIPIGIAALVQLAVRRGQLRGWPLAVGGTAFAALLVGWSAYVIYEREHVTYRKSTCLMNVKHMADALRMYAADYGAFPPSEQWESQSLRQYVESDKVYVCPTAPKLRSGYAYSSALSGVTPEAIGDAGRTVGVFESDRGWNAAGGLELLVRVPRHYKGDNVGFVDGHAKWYLRQALISKENADYFVWEPPRLELLPRREAPPPRPGSVILP